MDEGETFKSKGRRDKMTDIVEQFHYVVRDGSMHQNFEIDVNNQIKTGLKEG